MSEKYPDTLKEAREWNAKLNARNAALTKSKFKGLYQRTIPLAWQEKVSRLPGKPFDVGDACWCASGFAKSRTFTISAKFRRIFNLGAKGLRNGLSEMEKAGLITVKHKPGCSPEVTILEAQDDG